MTTETTSTVTIDSPPRPRDLVSELLTRRFGLADGELLIGGVPVSSLVAQFGSPLFVYDLDIIRQQFRDLRYAYPEKFEIYYSVKANPAQAVLKTCLALGCGLEIASSGELVQALAAGCSPERILFAGPGKQIAELGLALEHGIGEIHVESRTEALRLAHLAAERQQRARISLRVNPAAAVAGGGMRMGAKPAPFGIDEDQLDELLTELLQLPALEIVGLHLFMGTQILDQQVLIAQYRAGLDIARRLQARLGRPLETVDFGGGLGVPYFAQDARLDLDALRLSLHEWLAELTAAGEFAHTRFVIEPGRFLVAEGGIYVATVTDLKTSRGKRFAMVDGGMHHHLAASGNLGQTIKRNFPVAVLNKLGAPTAAAYDVCGPLCTPLDVLARGCELPELELGDLVGVFQSGAYARSASPAGFLSRQSPAEVAISAGQPRLIRSRGLDADYLTGQPD